MLSPDQVTFFETNGYIAVENVVDPGTLDAVRAEYADLLDALYADWHAQGLVQRTPDGMGFWEKIEECYRAGFDWFQPIDISLPLRDITEDSPMHFGPAVFDLARNKGILDIVEQLIGPEITSNPIQHVRIKPPERSVPGHEVRAHIVSTDWHQDMGVTLEEADNTKMVTVWVAITDATVDNGCLQVAPGRRESILPHCSRTQVGISNVHVPKQATPTPVKAGGAVIFHPLTPHASLANTSDGYRWSFDLRYNVTGQPTGRPQFPEFVARSRKNPETELRDWQLWRESWETARTTLANAPHIAQHRWPSDGPFCA